MKRGVHVNVLIDAVLCTTLSDTVLTVTQTLHSWAGALPATIEKNREGK